MMERSKPQLVASGIVGSNGTLGNEMVFSKFNERTSISLGQFHYETNGFRTNNDQNHDILNAFVQHAVTSKLNVQAELRTRSTDHGIYYRISISILFLWIHKIEFDENSR
ncbi:MAG: hypothetical protein IPO71_07790 [Nitrosomonas sp.]|nr:hypothetical protein [Nitrosomonas sp.]